jgi:hypothetical protein
MLKHPIASSDTSEGASVRKSDKLRSAVAGGALAAFAALTLGVPPALADPDAPSPPLPGPGPAPAEQLLTTQAAAGDPAAPPAQPAPPTEVQHLSSPQNLPPGTTDVPLDQGQSGRGSYLRDLWHAVQTQDISGKDAAILFLTQRPMNANAMPTNGLPTGPQAPPGTPPPLGAPAPDAPPVADTPAPGPVLPGPAPAPGAPTP